MGIFNRSRNAGAKESLHKRTQRRLESDRADRIELQKRAEAWWFSLSDNEKAGLVPPDERGRHALFYPERNRRIYWFVYILAIVTAGFSIIHFLDHILLKIGGALVLYVAWRNICDAQQRRREGLVFDDAASALDVVGIYREHAPAEAAGGAPGEGTDGDAGDR